MTSAEVQGVTTSVLTRILCTLIKYSVARQPYNQAIAAQRGREAAKAAENCHRNGLEIGTAGKLTDAGGACRLRANDVVPSSRGDSAGGSAKQASDRRYHAILPLRGKILNTERIALPKVLSNTEVKAIIAAIGGGMSADFKVEEMRYGGVAIMTDADVDGAHIRTLLHTLFWRHMKPMVLAGKLFIALAPLYQLRKGKETRYAYSDEERDKILARWGKDAVTIQRYKGLGEMNPEQLRETVFALNKLRGNR